MSEPIQIVKRVIRRPLPQAGDEQGRSIVEHAVIQGEGDSIFIGFGQEPLPGGQNATFQFPIPAKTLDEAFDGFDVPCEAMRRNVRQQIAQAQAQQMQQQIAAQEAQRVARQISMERGLLNGNHR